MVISQERHNIEIQENYKRWASKPVLQEIYKDFYKRISFYIKRDIEGVIAEIGSGIGNLKTVIPDCICTDIFDNPWIDRLENSYELSFSNNTVSNLILFDVFHHLEYPGSALDEFRRVLVPGGRLIIFDPAISLLGLIVYGFFHHEPIRLKDKIKWFAPATCLQGKTTYYAAQGNTSRIFSSNKYNKLLSGWSCIVKKKMSAISYAASGGYSKPQLYPKKFLPGMMLIEKVCDFFPYLFATRILVVLEKNEAV